MTQRRTALSPTQLVNFEWPRMMSPHWVEEHEDLVLRDSSQGRSDEWYRPLTDEPALFRHFARLDGSPESFSAFARKYGDLGGWLDPQNGASLTRWQAEHEWLKYTVRLWDAARDERPDRVLGSIVHLRPVGRDIGLFLESERRPGEPWGGEPWAALGTGPWATLETPVGPQAQTRLEAEAVLIALTESINLGLTDTHVRPVMKQYSGAARESTDIGIRLTFTVETLLAAMWLQFALAVNGNRDYRICPVCGDWWDATDVRSDRQTCSDRCRKERSRRRRSGEQS